MGHVVRMGVTKHLKEYIGFNGEILNGINGQPIGQINQDNTEIPNQATNPTEDRAEGEVGTPETKEGEG